MQRLVVLLLASLSLSILGGWEGCGEPVLEDPSFDLWCGDKLCAWQVDAGRVRRVPTWHRSDFGVELEGNPVQISQLSKVTSAQTTCLLFELQADREDGVSLRLELDFLDDGSAEYSHDLPSDDWEQVKYRVATPAWYEWVRFKVRKTGAGRAVLGHIRASKSSECDGPPLALPDRPGGAKCGSGSDCKSGKCLEVLEWGTTRSQVCGGCSTSSDCGAGKACGLEAASRLKPYPDCGALGRHQLGERCLSDEECATGVCCEGSCGECCATGTIKSCGGSATCRRRDWKSLGAGFDGALLPFQCSPGEKTGAALGPCLRADDCASNVCSATADLKQCVLDGRRCQTDGDCPLWPTCLAVGKLGGKCQ